MLFVQACKQVVKTYYSENIITNDKLQDLVQNKSILQYGKYISTTLILVFAWFLGKLTIVPHPHSGADLNVLCKHFKKLKYNNLGSNCHFVDVKFKETF